MENVANTAREAERLAVLDELGILDTPAEQSYDDLTALAAFICGTPTSLVSLVAETRQFFKSTHNFPVHETPRAHSFCAQALGTGRTLVVEDALRDDRFADNPLVASDPKIRFYAGAPIFGEGGQVLGTLCVIDREPRTLSTEQITALEALARQATELLHQRHLVRQLRHSGEKLQTKTLQLGLAVEAGKLGVYTWRPASDSVVWENDRVFEIFGRTREQGPLTSAEFLEEFVRDDDRRSFADAGSRVQKAGDRLVWVGGIDHPDGTLHWLEVLGLAEKTREGDLLVVGTVADVTERKNGELRKQLDRERLDVALTASEASTFDWFPDADRIYWGGVLPFGRKAETLPRAVEVFELVHPDDRERLNESISRSLLEGDDFGCDFRAFWPDGSLHWVRGVGRLIPMKDGVGRRLVGVNLDVTALKVAEQELALERERLELALRSTKATTFDWVPETDVVVWGGMPPFGVDPALIPTGASSFEYVHEEDRAALRGTLAGAQERDEDYAFEYRGLWEDGSTRWIRTAGRPIKDSEGRVRLIGVNTDVTDRKLSEDALLQSEKLAAVGKLASVISHEINNPLEAVTNLLYIVRASEKLSQQDKDHLELADRELARVSQITAQTLRFHRDVRRPGSIEAAAIVHELLSLYRTRLTDSNIDVKLRLDNDVKFSAFEGEIRQVLNNLVGNAFDAMRNGGVLHIRTRCVTDAGTGKMGACITVADTGAGIPTEAYGRIFQAFNSTKGLNGTGLGLWISKRIVHKHRGHLVFRSSTGERHGTVFRLWVPNAAASTAGDSWA